MKDLPVSDKGKRFQDGAIWVCTKREPQGCPVYYKQGNVWKFSHFDRMTAPASVPTEEGVIDE